ncbi:MAG: hypothetical protein NPIRA04_00510 [Nitrospirales bacterium]|nr:MAG: hypothetical protein NPIRA04_00510 [Nitrospirales bacterium]
MRSHTLHLRNVIFPIVMICLTCSYSLTTYAQETDKDMPVGAVGGAVHADPFTGTATTSIPIEVPPGRQGVQPDLALVYGSSNGNGWLGMGWKLEKGVIERQTKFGVDYSGDDYVFRLSGINVELVNIGNDEYRAKVEGGFTRVKKRTATDGKPYFEATDKSGKTFIFGSVAATRVANPNDASKIFRWCLERVEDVHGNYMTFSYTSDQGQAYLAQIDYTGHENTVPTNKVIFHLENRPDNAPMYVPNFEMTTAKRLKTIEVRGNNNIIRAYKLEYALSQSTGRSGLKTVRQYGSNAALTASGDIINGTSLPPVSLTSSEAVNSFAAPTVWLNGSGTYNQGYQFPGDFNGDGKQDWMYLNGSWYVALSNGQGFDVPTAWLSGSGTYNLEHQYVADFNGDGKDDWMYLNGSWYVALSNGNGFNPPVKWLNGSGPGGVTYNQGYQYLGDYNGDGKQDYMYWRNAWYVALSNGNGFNTPIAWFTGQGPSGWPYNASAYQYVGDFNGDGKHDWMYLNGDWYVMLSTGSSFQYPSKWLSGSGTYNPGHQYVADFNGDGKQDWMYLNGSWRVALSNGQSFKAPSVWLSGSGTYNLGHQFPGDFNGDGKTDWMYLNGNWRVALSNGQGFKTPTTWLSGSGTYNLGHQFPGDFNGDGKTDWMYLNGNWHVAKREGTNDLLENITNGLGATTTIRYMPSSHYSNTQLPYPIQTVNFIKTNDGNGNEAVTYYDYNGGFHHIGKRDFRGFNYVKVTGPAGPNGEQTVTSTWFHQGNDWQPDVNNPNVADGFLKGAPYRVKVQDGQGNIYTETVTTYLEDTDGAPFFAPPISVITNIHDGTAIGKQTQTDYEYDVHGNVTREDHYGDTGTSADDRTVVRTYSPNTTDWILSLPKSETTYEGLGTSNQLAHTDFYYDGTTSCSTPSSNQQPTKGQLTRVVKWLNGGTDPETRMAYDSQGNVICTRDAKDNTTTMAYDASGTFATTVTNSLGHVTTTQYYGVNGVAMDLGLYGQVKSVTDPNGAVVLTEHDALGRRIKVTQPDGFWTTTSYNSFGTVGSQHVRTDSQLGLSSWTYFDGLGRTITQKSTGTDSKTIVTQTDYDARGGVTRTSTPYFETGGTPVWSTNTYDPMGRVIKTDNPDGSRNLVCFDDWVTVTIDANDHKRRTTRDAYGRVATVQEYTGTFTSCDTSAGTPYSTTTYQYDDLGNLLTLTDALGNQSTMAYDTLSRKISMHDPDMGNWTL